MNVIVINEEDNGMVGIAKDYKSAIDFLFKEDWLSPEFEVMDKYDNYVPLKELNMSIDDIKQMGIDEFNKFFEGCFYLDIDTVWGM